MQPVCRFTSKHRFRLYIAKPSHIVFIPSFFVSSYFLFGYPPSFYPICNNQMSSFSSPSPSPCFPPLIKPHPRPFRSTRFAKYITAYIRFRQITLYTSSSAPAFYYIPSLVPLSDRGSIGPITNARKSRQMRIEKLFCDGGSRAVGAAAVGWVTLARR